MLLLLRSALAWLPVGWLTPIREAHISLRFNLIRLIASSVQGAAFSSPSHSPFSLWLWMLAQRRGLIPL